MSHAPANGGLRFELGAGREVYRAPGDGRQAVRRRGYNGASDLALYGPLSARRESELHQQTPQPLHQRGAWTSADAAVPRVTDSIMKKKSSRRQIDVNVDELDRIIDDAMRARHLTERDFGIVGPENPPIFIFIIVEANSCAILLLERFSMLQVLAPRQDGVAEIKFVRQHIFGRLDLCGNPASRFKDRGIVPPGVGDNVAAIRLPQEASMTAYPSPRQVYSTQGQFVSSGFHLVRVLCLL